MIMVPIVSVAVQFTQMPTLTLQIQQILNAYFVKI